MQLHSLYCHPSGARTQYRSAWAAARCSWPLRPQAGVGAWVCCISPSRPLAVSSEGFRRAVVPPSLVHLPGCASGSCCGASVSLPPRARLWSPPPCLQARPLHVSCSSCSSFCSSCAVLVSSVTVFLHCSPLRASPVVLQNIFFASARSGATFHGNLPT